MRIALFSDVHANLHALQAMLADVEGLGVDQVYCLGDLVGYGAYPNEVIALVRDRGIPTIMGNYDQGIAFAMGDCGCAYKTPEARRLGQRAYRWTEEHVTAESRAFLRSLPPGLRFVLDGRRVMLVHGSPRRINEYFYEDRPEASFARLAQASETDVLVMGHTHLPYSKEVAGVLFANAGSVGKPKDGDARAAYILLEVGDRVEVKVRRVAYDVAAATAAVRASSLPPELAAMLESATG